MGERLAGCQCDDRTPDISGAGHTGDRDADAHRTEVRRVSFFFAVVNERQQFDVGSAGEDAKHMVRADAIASVRRVRQTTSEREDLQADWACGFRCRTTRGGTPAAMTKSGRGLLTTAPAPTTVPRPTSAITTAALPIHEPAPIRTTRRCPG